MKIMKRILPLALIILASCGGHHKPEKYEADPDCVYVCSGRNARRYHSVDNCKGISKCSGEVIEMTIEEAENEYKTPCRICVK